MQTTVTPVVPSGSVALASGRPLFSDVQKAFPGLAGSSSNLIGYYFARAPSLAPPVAQSNVVGAEPPTQLFSRFMGLTALTPTFGALSNAPVQPDLHGFAAPVNGTNAVFLAGGLLTALVGGNSGYAASLSVNLFDYLDNRRFHLGTGVCAFAVDPTSPNALPSGALSVASASLGTLALSTSTTTSYNRPVVFRCTNFYGNRGTFTVTLNLVQAPYVAGPTAVYVGESFCPATGQWADATGNGKTASVTAGSMTQAWTLNGRAVLSGSTAARVTFPGGVLPGTGYTIFLISKYSPTAGATSRRILTSSDGANWLSGHYGGMSGVAHHGGWITPTTSAVTGWALGTDQANLYRVNGIQRGTSGAGSQGAWCTLGINTYGTEQSDFSIAYLAVYAATLSGTQIYYAEQALAAQYGLAWLAASIAGRTLNSDSYTVDLATIFSNCSSYAVSSDPRSSAAITGGSVTVTGAYRNTSYAVQVSGSSSAGSIAYASFVIVENQMPPAVTSNPGTQNVSFGGSAACGFSGPDLSYSSSSSSTSEYGYMSGSTYNINADYRNTMYTVTVTAKNTRYDGLNEQSASLQFEVNEYQQNPTSSAIDTQSLGTGSTSINLYTYFNAKNGSSPSFSISGGSPGGALSVSGSTLTISAAYRNMSYSVTVTLKTKDRRGWNEQSTSQTLTVVERGPPQVCADISGTWTDFDFFHDTFDISINVATGIGSATNTSSAFSQTYDLRSTSFNTFVFGTDFMTGTFDGANGISWNRTLTDGSALYFWQRSG